MRALALILASIATPALVAHGYGDLALSPDGRSIATIEQTAANGTAIVIRGARDGHIVRTIDPCETCRYSVRPSTPPPL